MLGERPHCRRELRPVACCRFRRHHIVPRPLLTRIRGQIEGLDHLLELVHHRTELVHIRARHRRRRFEVTLGFESKAVHTKLRRGVKVPAVHARTTTRGALPRVDLALQLLPRRLLGRVQCHTSRRPSVSTPLRTVIIGIDDLLQGRQLCAVRRTDSRRLVVGELIVADVEHLASVRQVRKSIRRFDT